MARKETKWAKPQTFVRVAMTAKNFFTREILHFPFHSLTDVFPVSTFILFSSSLTWLVHGLKFITKFIDFHCFGERYTERTLAVFVFESINLLSLVLVILDVGWTSLNHTLYDTLHVRWEE